MADKSISYDLDGQTVTGRYALAGHADTLAVSVQFEGHSISAFIGQLRPETVARTLLGELVRARLAEAEDKRQPGEKIAQTDRRAVPLHYRYGPAGSHATAA